MPKLPGLEVAKASRTAGRADAAAATAAAGALAGLGGEIRAAGERTADALDAREALLQSEAETAARRKAQEVTLNLQIAEEEMQRTSVDADEFNERMASERTKIFDEARKNADARQAFYLEPILDLSEKEEVFRNQLTETQMRFDHINANLTAAEGVAEQAFIAARDDRGASSVLTDYGVMVDSAARAGALTKPQAEALKADFQDRVVPARQDRISAQRVQGTVEGVLAQATSRQDGLDRIDDLQAEGFLSPDEAKDVRTEYTTRMNQRDTAKRRDTNEHADELRLQILDTDFGGVTEASIRSDNRLSAAGKSSLVKMRRDASKGLTDRETDILLYNGLVDTLLNDRAAARRLDLSKHFLSLSNKDIGTLRSLQSSIERNATKNELADIIIKGKTLAKRRATLVLKDRGTDSSNMATESVRFEYNYEQLYRAEVERLRASGVDRDLNPEEIAAITDQALAQVTIDEVRIFPDTVVTGLPTMKQREQQIDDMQQNPASEWDEVLMAETVDYGIEVLGWTEDQVLGNDASVVILPSEYRRAAKAMLKDPERASRVTLGVELP